MAASVLVSPDSGALLRKVFYRGNEFRDLLNWRHMAALIDGYEFSPGDFLRVAFARGDRQQCVLFSPNHQRRHMNAAQLSIKPFARQCGIAQNTVHRVADIRVKPIGRVC